MLFFYFAYRYNVLFVTDTQIDTRGLIYPRALKQLMTGVYLSEICMIGLFGASVAPIQLALQVVFLVFTILFHISMSSALDPLLYNMPQSLLAEEEARRIGDVEGASAAVAPAAVAPAAVAPAAVAGSGAGAGAPGGPEITPAGPLGADASNVGPAEYEKAGYAAGSVPNVHNVPNGGNADNADHGHGYTGALAPIPPKGNVLLRFLKPWVYANYETMRTLLPEHANAVNFKNMYTPEVEKTAYLPPSASSEPPLLWIPEDPAGISKQEIVHSQAAIGMTDASCVLTDEGKLEWDRENMRPPIWNEEVVY